MDKELEELLKLAGIGHAPRKYNADGEDSPLTHGSENIDEADEYPTSNDSIIIDWLRTMHANGTLDLGADSAAEDALNVYTKHSLGVDGEIIPDITELQKAIDYVRQSADGIPQRSPRTDEPTAHTEYDDEDYESAVYSDKLLNKYWRIFTDTVSQVYPDGDPIDMITAKYSDFDMDKLTAAAAKHGYSHPMDYWEEMDNIGEDSLMDEASTAHKAKKTYQVVGNYGVHADEYIVKYVSAETEQEAIEQFANHVKKSQPVAWGRMGYSNITAREGQPMDENLADVDVRIDSYGKVDPKFADDPNYKIVIRSPGGKQYRYRDVSAMKKRMGPAFKRNPNLWDDIRAGKTEWTVVRDDTGAGLAESSESWFDKYFPELKDNAAKPNSDLINFVRQLHLDGETDLDDPNAANDIDAMLAYEEPAEGEAPPTVEEIRAAIDLVRSAVEEDMLKPKGEPDLYDAEIEDLDEADDDDDYLTPGRGLDDQDEDEENPEVDFVEGDLVMIGYGHNEGKAAEVIEFSPSGMFATVRLKNGDTENHHVGDLFALDSDFDEEEYYGIDLEDEENLEEDQDTEVETFYAIIGDDISNLAVIMLDQSESRYWHESHVYGDGPDNVGGKRYMSYLSPEDVMSWLRRDYSVVYGPYLDEYDATMEMDRMQEDDELEEAHNDGWMRKFNKAMSWQDRKPADIMARVRDMTDDELLAVADRERTLGSGSARNLQIRAVDRELKRRFGLTPKGKIKETDMNIEEGAMSELDIEIRASKEAGKSDEKIAAEIMMDFDVGYEEALEMVRSVDIEECGVYEDEYVDENAFNTARDEAIAGGKKSFSFNGKTYPVTNVGDDDVDRAKDRFAEDLDLEDDYEADMCELVIDNESAFYFLADNFTAEMSFSEGGNICLPERLRGKAEMLLTAAGFSEGDDFYFVDAVEEADLQNGYDDHHYVDGEDYFPTGNDGPAPKKLGPSAARHGNNPLGTSMKVDESNNLHESLKKQYRKFRTL